MLKVRSKNLKVHFEDDELDGDVGVWDLKTESGEQLAVLHRLLISWRLGKKANPRVSRRYLRGCMQTFRWPGLRIKRLRTNQLVTRESIQRIDKADFARLPQSAQSDIFTSNMADLITLLEDDSGSAATEQLLKELVDKLVERTEIFGSLSNEGAHMEPLEPYAK